MRKLIYLLLLSLFVGLTQIVSGQPINTIQIAKKEGTNIEVPSNEDGSKTLKENEIETLRAALLATQGNRTKAAERLGISRRGLLKKMKRFELED